jgi:hypothetical protein
MSATKIQLPVQEHPMQHSHLSSPHTAEHHALLRAMKYLPFIAIGLLAAYEHSPGLLVVLAIGVGLSLAFKQRMDESSHNARLAARTQTARVAGDGGSFPGEQPKADTPPPHHNVVIDGGSLEHHQNS